MKKLTLAALMAYAGLVGVNAHAAPLGKTVQGTFGVDITLTSACKINTTGTGLTMAYTAFGNAQTGSTSVKVTCTNGIGFSLALDGATPGSYTHGGTGLNYTLALSSNSSTNDGINTGIDDGTEQTFYVNASIAAGQGGVCTTATCSGTDTRTLTVSY